MHPHCLQAAATKRPAATPAEAKDGLPAVGQRKRRGGTASSKARAAAVVGKGQKTLHHFFK